MALRRQKRLLNRCGQNIDARHHCVAWVAGAPDDSQQLGFSDDGEPAGTAGKTDARPTNGQRRRGNYRCGGALLRRHIVWHRWVSESVWRRRESGAAPANDPTQTPLTEYTLQCEYSQLTGIEALLGQCDGKIINSDYQAFVLLRVALGGESG